jgi:hypothetical protein
MGSPSSITITDGGSCSFDPYLAQVTCLSSSIQVVSSVTIELVDMELPFQSTLVKIATAYAINSTDQTLYARVDFSTTGTLSAATVQNIVARQYDTKLFYFEFELPTDFQMFNPQDCTPGSCPQSFEISSTSLTDFDSYEIISGIGTAITLQQIPTSNSYMQHTWTAGTKTLNFNGFRLLTNGAKVCFTVRTISAPTVGGIFNINLKHLTSITATGTITITVSTTVPSSVLTPYIKS